jgi:hypothetical protein
VSAIDSVEELISLIRENGDIAHYGDGCSEEMLDSAEDCLGLRFPPSYRRLVAEFGTCDIAGEEFLGVYQTSAMGDELLGSVRETRKARKSYGLPPSMIVVTFDGMGGLIVLDTAKQDSYAESPVLAWVPGAGASGQTQGLSTDFGTYALSVCEEAVRNWREY